MKEDKHQSIENKSSKSLYENRQYDLFKKYKYGDYKARKEIIEFNMGLVNYVIKEMFLHTDYDVKDLIEMGRIGLIKAVDSFDMNKNVKFSSYAIKCIKNEISMFIKKEKKHENNYSLDDPILDGNKTYLDAIIDTSCDIILEYEEKELYSIIRKIVEELPDIDKKIIKLYFGFNSDKQYTQIEICEKLCLKKRQVSKSLNSSLNKIKLFLKSEGLVDYIPKEKKKSLTWDEMYLLAEAYYNHYNNLEIKFNFKTINGYEYNENGYCLGNWIANQRAADKNKRLSLKRKDLLLLIKMRFETADYEEIWNEWYNLAKAYYEHHGNLKIKFNFKTINGYEYDENGKCLGIWYRDQINLYKKSTLSPTKINLLKKISNVFDSEEDKEKVNTLCLK